MNRDIEDLLLALLATAESEERKVYHYYSGCLECVSYLHLYSKSKVIVATVTHAML